ncbi:hypothetical protein Fmac_007004 [Flemingia macrophylla]|uniref:RING-type E3 ubiquitin transferase n=1 Tax=Flemingia macrophylla TaxID=520843 RepID=A0ABD1NC87_9FABA
MKVKRTELAKVVVVVEVPKSPHSLFLRNEKTNPLSPLPPLPGVAQAQAQAQPQPNNDATVQQFNPSLAVVIIILVAALFLVAFFSIYIRHCADSSPNTLGPAAAAAARARRAARGLDPELIETFPILQYSDVKNHKIGKESLECAVCLCEFEDSETLRLIPKCDHVFHPDCIDEWLKSHTTCPVCRANLSPAEPDHAAGVAHPEEPDVEAQNDAAVESSPEHHNTDTELILPEPEVISVDKTLNRNRTRGSRSNRTRRFPRSHSTGHSLVQPGENTERFTLRLPVEVRNELLNSQLQRASSVIVLPRESSSRRGYRSGEGSSRGKGSRSRSLKSERSILTMAAPFLARALSIRSPRVRNGEDEDTPSSSSTAPIRPPSAVDSARPPV